MKFLSFLKINKLEIIMVFIENFLFIEPKSNSKLKKIEKVMKI